MGLFGNHSSGAKRTVAHSVPLIKSAAAGSAVPLEEIEQHGGVSLRKKTEASVISLQKKNLAGIQAQVVVVLDHSGSMYSDYMEHKVQDIVERFLGFALAIDMDGEVPVIPFDDRVHPATVVTMDNYYDVVDQKIWKRNDMGSTDLTAALKEVRKIAEATDAPLFVAVVTDGDPNYRDTAKEVICDLARYPVFVKFLAVRPVAFLRELDDLGDDQRLLDNVDTKEYINLATVTEDQFADDMADEWDSWTEAALKAGILTEA